MTQTPPHLPKRLASRIVAAQNKVTSVRGSIINSDRRIKQSTTELAEFDADPYAYARKHYGNHGVDSYPVQTRRFKYRQENISTENKLVKLYFTITKTIFRKSLAINPIFGKQLLLSN